MKRLILPVVLSVIVLIGVGSIYLGTVGVFIPEQAVQKRVKATVEVRQVSLNTRHDGTVFVSGNGNVEAMGATVDLRFSGAGFVTFGTFGTKRPELVLTAHPRRPGLRGLEISRGDLKTPSRAFCVCGDLRGRQEAMRCFRPRFPVECPERRLR